MSTKQHSQEQGNTTMHVCIPKFLPIELQGDAQRVAFDENLANLSFVLHAPDAEGYMRAAMQTSKRWANGRTITVSFMGGSPAVHKLVKPYFHEWSRHANIKFDFIDKNGEIRVAFEPGGSWSYLGTDALLIPRADPTINFGWLTEASTDNEVRRVVLHEVGHALGLEHELQQPGASVQWDIDKVVAYFVGPPNYWTREDVYHNVINKISPEGVEYTSFDDKSIMAYAVPAAWTKNNVEVPFNTYLSKRDIEFIGKMYPKSSKPPVTTPSVIDPTFPLLPHNEYMQGNVNFNDNVNEYRVLISEPGTYRFWSSYVGGRVSIVNDNGQVASGIQQLTTDLTPGEYLLKVRLTGQAAIYRIKYRKLK